MDGLLAVPGFMLPWEFSPVLLASCALAFALYWRGAIRAEALPALALYGTLETSQRLEFAMQLLVIAALLFAAVSVLFAVQNNVPVTVTFLLWRFDGSLALVLLIAMALGGMIVALVSTPSTLRGQWERQRQRKRIVELEQTCSAQETRLAQLQPAAPAAESAPREQAYVGLKQLVAGAGGADRPGSPGSKQE